ncbi:MAG: hypothetical protein U0359_16900 [Byssovorax sp.]
MERFGIETKVTDRETLKRAAAQLGKAKIILPTFAQLADPTLIPPRIREALGAIDPDAPHPLNLFRVHWFNAANRRSFTAVPEHVVLPRELTGVASPIVVALGDRFPMIGAHKVLAAYGCLVPRLVTGRFDPATDRALWPSTGNYCRGGVAISRILDCRGVAILPAEMSEERFRWLGRWVKEPSDIVKTRGSESNVKEIYDRCAELSRDPRNVILNQFSQFENHLVHELCTGRAMSAIFEAEREAHPGYSLFGFVSATGSAGTIAAGDHLKERYGSKTVAVEPVECPTLLYNGFGAHNIQGIGDKHVPLIHNVMGTDVVTAISDRATDALALLFNHPAGLDYLRARRNVPEDVIEKLSSFGLSSICNTLAAIKTAKAFHLGPNDVLMTVATDGAALYQTEMDKVLGERFEGTFDERRAGEVYAQYLGGAGTDHLAELSDADRRRIFNLGYFTWVEQQGVSLEDFEARRQPSFWRGLREALPLWDERIAEMNRLSSGEES